jgi:transposase-like protein
MRTPLSVDRSQERPSCPRCRDPRVVRWGRYGNGRRYRCVGCGRTFSPNTGTPLAYLKKAHLWDLFCECMRDSSTVREAADRLGVDKDTAFRWRHRFLDAVRAGTCGVPGGPQRWAEPLAGRIFVAESWFMFSEKGKRPLDRPARRHAWVTNWLSAPRAWVVLMADDQGRALGQLAGLHRPMVDDYERVVATAVAHGRSVLVSRDGPYAQLPRAARQLGIRHERCVVWDAGARAQAYRRRLKSWLQPFFGVATRYLPNYLAWHRWVDAAAPHPGGSDRSRYCFP